jgi:uncharacterized iron-regulated membrane protein
MNTKRLFRQVHYWVSLFVMGPLAVMIIAGLFLMVKKEVSWIQPSTQRGEVAMQAPALSMDALLEICRQYPEAQIDDWSDVSKVDFRPDRGIAKFIAESGWEIQLDTATGDALSVAYRRSDLIESLHDGSFFADWTKLGLFLPVGIGLLIMHLSGIYMFLLPRLARNKKRERLQRNKATQTLNASDS